MEELWKDGRRPEGSCAVSASVGLTSCLPPSLNHPSDAGGSDEGKKGEKPDCENWGPGEETPRAAW